jgi:L-2-hydroxyglutarate oxidase
MLEEFCEREGIAFERCGKVVVATDESELPALGALEERARANQIAIERIGPERLTEIEPATRGIAALWVPGTGIVDFIGVCGALARRIRESGGEVRCGTQVSWAKVTERGVFVETNRGSFEASVVVGCAGLQADRVARLFGIEPEVQIVPFRGEYYWLSQAAMPLVRHLIYPVPDPRFPFLGVHFTRRHHGRIDCGPNAVLALGREAYESRVDDLSDLVDTLTYPGFLRLAKHHFAHGLAELHRSWSKAAFVKALQRLVPAIRESDLSPAPCGIRAQGVARDGSLYNDFLIQEQPRVVCMLNAPSPAATASLEIGRRLAERVIARLASRASSTRR